MKKILMLLLLFFAEIANCQEIKTDTLNNVGNKTVFNTKIYHNIIMGDTMAEFPGGNTALYKFLNKNLQYPSTIKCVTGTVFLSFVVNEDGKLSDIKVLRGVNKELDEEAIRIIKLMPDWLPAIRNGKAYYERYNLPIKFKAD
jgi:TonB family protein